MSWPLAIVEYLNGTTKTSGTELRQHFTAPKYGWPAQLTRYVVAALFVDARVTLVDKSGRRHDDPKTPEARAVLGSKEFGSTRVVVEEMPPGPKEASAIRDLLQDLGQITKDDSVLTLHEGMRVLLLHLEKRLSVTERAKAAQLPLPVAIDGVRDAIDDIAAATTRTKGLRALLANAGALRDGVAELTAVEGFVGAKGLEQFQRASAMVKLCDQIGLDDDPELGPTVVDAKEQLEELRAQRRVIAEWTTGFETARELILQAYRSRYAPAYEQARVKVESARAAIIDSPEFASIGEKGYLVRSQFMGAGRQLEQIPVATLTGEADLIAAADRFSLPLLRAKTSGADKAVAEAMVFIAGLAPGDKVSYTTWETSSLIGKAFTDEAKVDEAFDRAKEEIKALIRQGKTVRTI